MQLSYLVVDDFLDNPEELRNIALTSKFHEPTTQSYFPGRNSENAVTMRELDRVISNLVGEKLRPKEGTSHGKFRLALENDKGAANIHIDNCHWSCLLYLTPDEYCQGGTEFYRHKATNMEHAPYTKEQLTSIGLTDFKQVWDDIIIKDTNSPESWEHMMTVPMKYNRLVLFRPWLYHNAGRSFGNSIENGRLIYPLFYQNA